MGQGATDASDAGSARGRVRDEDQTVILPRVDAGKARPDAGKARPDAGKPHLDADKARADADKARADAGQKRADAVRALDEDARAQELAKEFLAQELLAQDLLTDVPWPDDNSAYAGERPPAELATSLASGLATFPYLGRTIRRRARVWCILAVVGLALGLGLHYVKPPPAKATTSVQLTYPTASNPMDAIATEVALVQSQTVARQAERELGLTENVNKFAASYTATSTTDRIIVITVSAPTSSEAVRRATTLAQVYLQFQSSQLQGQQRGVSAQLTQEIAGYYRKLGADDAAITKAQAARPGSSQQTLLHQLTGQLTQDKQTLSGLQSALQDYVLNNQLGNDQVEFGSEVLDRATLLPPSKVKSSAAYAVGGLAAGLLIGIVIVIIGALVSDKLRRRDDIARALSAPVELSVGRVRARRRSRQRDLAAIRDRHLQRVVTYMDRLIPGRSARRAPALVVIPLDAPQTGALAVAAVAFARAQRDQKVVLADLLDGAPGRALAGGQGARHARGRPRRAEADRDRAGGSRPGRPARQAGRPGGRRPGRPAGRRCRRLQQRGHPAYPRGR